MMRKLEPGLYECAEHGGTYSKREAFDHLMAEHAQLAESAERILDANRENTALSINPLVRSFGELAGEAANAGNRAERRARARKGKA